jgi:hypothetical protein
MLSWWFLSSSRMSSVESTSTTAQRVSPPGSSLDASCTESDRPGGRESSWKWLGNICIYILYYIILYMYYNYYCYYYVLLLSLLLWLLYYICINIYMNYPINVGFDVCIFFQQCGFWRAIVGLSLIEVIWRKLWSHCGWWGACKILQGRGWCWQVVGQTYGDIPVKWLTKASHGRFVPGNRRLPTTSWEAQGWSSHGIHGSGWRVPAVSRLSKLEAFGRSKMRSPNRRSHVVTVAEYGEVQILMWIHIDRYIYNAF